MLTYIRIYIHTHIHTHFPDKNSRHLQRIFHQKKNFILKFKLYFTILLQYHLAEDLVLINCQNIMKYAEIALYNQFGMLTWFKILVILLLYTYIVYIRI